MQSVRCLAWCSGSALVLTASWAAAAQPTVVEAPVSELRPIVVSAAPLDRGADEIAGPVLVLEGADLNWRRQPTLGDTLDGEPGIHSDNFGAGASRPVIRGQTAPRVSVLSDGSPLLDASAVSPDHVVDVETGLARRIEVLRGPATLLYGGGAIGGVVNVLDDKIPTAVPERGVEGDLRLLADTGARRRSAAVGLTAGTGSFAVRFEGLRGRSDDYRVPDQATSRQPDTFTDTKAGTLGMSWITSRGYAGIAWTEQRRQYGLPGHSHDYADCHPHGSHLHCGGHDHGHGHGHAAHGLFALASSHDDDHGHDHDDHDHDHGEHGDHDHDHDHDHAGPWIDQKSRRLDWRADYRDPLPGFSRVRLRGGWTDYRHDEIEEDITATRFRNRGHDGRIELDHKPLAGWRGTLGASWLRSDFDVTGLEAFMPRTVTQSQGLFLVETYELGDWRFEAGARQDWQRVRPDDQQPSWRGSATSLSAAALWSFTPGYNVGLTLSRSQRMPNAQELYARGVHLATNTYEIGNPELSRETGYNADLTLRKIQGDTRFEVSAYHHRIRNYIYADTLDRYEDFRLIEYRQRDATFTGVEGRVEQRLTPIWSVVLSGDLVRARFSGGGDLPRMPAARLGAGVRAQWQGWSGRVDVFRVFAQNRIAEFESSTPGYTMVNAGVSYRWQMGGAGYEVSLRGYNLLNKVAYNHASYLANTVPLPGRNVVLGLNISY
ncbi:MAG: TonB-dependent receptor [Pigmentiphaga sp.]|nr:TonB-dependent receptor [Pigmentiphaga sp.]